MKKSVVAAVVSTALLTTCLCLGMVNKSEAVDKKFSMSYVYSGTTDSNINSVDRAKGNLNMVSPSYFDLNSNGSLKITAKYDARFVQEMKKRGIKVVPFLSNHWDRNLGRIALTNREQLSTQIADAISKYNLDGVNIDIENVTEVDRNNYTDLVRLIRKKVPATKEVSVAVAANPEGWTKGWHGSYDYKALASYSDYLMLMAYDESYEGSLPGPVASLGFAEKSIKQLLNIGVPKEKIVLGLPFYARYWVNGQGGAGIPLNRVYEIVNRYKGTIVFDTVSKSLKAIFTIHANDVPTNVGGQNLKPGNYTVWFEDKDSFNYKTRLVQTYGLKGIGSWSLGQEDPFIWNHYAGWLNGSAPLPNPLNQSNPSGHYSKLIQKVTEAAKK